ncbi:MAG: GTP 3',8-cyclase MoaA [Alphaproteobacteria bacterium]|nr:GTP 3',8-cyclase MoaA [Rhodospirillales bacterium]MCW9044919.1 GTP 3',8-cyclase MoaA [Alphaproteobacteria bacterium]
MLDPFGRTISYLRVSVTDKCDFRCHYCMSEEMEFLPREEVLSLEEMDRVCSAFISRGVEKLRLTGGEPLVRRGIMSLIKTLSRHLDSGALKELTLTTNGSQLRKYADELVEYGVKRINVSLDTLDPAKFAQITRLGVLEKVLDGIQAAKEAGLKIKINTVAVRGFNDSEFDQMISWCGDQGFDLTFIETMPLGEIGGTRSDQYLPLLEVKERLGERWTLSDNSLNTGGPSRYVDVAETGQKVGFITPLTEHFCDTCNRVRLTCTGTLYMCLGQDDSVDLRAPLRNSESDGPLLDAIDGAINNKPKGHEFVIDESNTEPSLARHMSVTGG